MSLSRSLQVLMNKIHDLHLDLHTFDFLFVAETAFQLVKRDNHAAD